MSVKKVIISIAISLLIFGMGVYTGIKRVDSHSFYYNTDSIIRSDSIIIDSLIILSNEYKRKSDSIISESMKDLESDRDKKKEVIIKLPPEEGVKFLKQKLREYEINK